MKHQHHIQFAVMAVCIAFYCIGPLASAQSNPPWWQQVVNKAEQKAENAVKNAVNGQKSNNSTTTNNTSTSSNQSMAGAPVVSSMSPNALLPFTKQTIILRGSGFGHQDPFNGPSILSHNELS